MYRRLLTAGLLPAILGPACLLRAGELLALHFSDALRDTSPAAHATAVSGAVTLVDGPTGFGRAARFVNPAPGPEVTPQWIDCGQDPRFRLAGNLSIAMWVKVAAPGPRSEEILLSNGSADGSEQGWRLFRHVDQQSLEFVARGEHSTVGGGLHSAVVDGRWRHFTLVREATGFRFYQDGRLLGGGGGGPFVPLSYEHLWIGGVPGQDLGFNGCLDEVLVFDQALSDDEVAALVMALTWRREGGRLELSWPVKSPGAELEVRAELGNPDEDWEPVAVRPEARDGWWHFEVPARLDRAFYRLRKL